MRTFLIMLAGLSTLGLLTALSSDRDATADPPTKIQTVALAAGSDDGERMIDERFNVAPGEQLAVSVPDADVRIETSRGNEAHIEVFLDARDMQRARAYFKDLEIQVARTGRTVRVEAQRERRTEWSWRGDRDGGARILVVAHIPEAFDVAVKSSDGDVTTGALEGHIDLRTSDGDIRAGNLRGPSVSLLTSDGDVEADAVVGEKVSFRTSDGDVRVRSIEAGRLLLRSSDGDIEADALSGEMEVVTSDGSIRVRTARGAEATFKTSDGDVRVDDLQAGRSEVTSSDGDLTLRRVEGDLRAVTSSGDIDVHLVKPAEVMLRTSDGDITITMAANYPADVLLRGEHVSLADVFGFRGSLREEYAEGSLNGGGPRLEARSSDGRVTVRGN